MDAKYRDALNEFFDGEDVDPLVLAESLGQPGAATLLAQYAALRVKARSGPRLAPEVLDAMAARLRQSARRQVWRRRFGRFAVVACLMLVAAGVGVQFGPVVERAGGPVSLPAVESPPPRLASRPTVAEPPMAATVPPTVVPRQPSLRDVDRPPSASLRFRLAQRWGETLADAGGEGPRR